MDDLMLQINGCRSNEAVMKVFNILFPYEKPLPRGKGDELGLSAMYGDGKTEVDPGSDLKDCHPDKLRQNLTDETNGAVTDAIKNNNVDDINDLLTMQNQMTSLQTANEMALVTLQQKDDKIAELTQELDAFRKNRKANGASDINMVALEEQVFQLKNINQKLEEDKSSLMDKVRSQVA